MLNNLPIELIYNVFELLDSSSDHVSLSSTCQVMFSVSLTPKLRCKLLEQFFSGAESNATFVNDPNLFSSLCEFIEAAKIKPISDNLMQVMEEQIETEHFSTYRYRNNLIKGRILDLFRPKCQILSTSLIAVPEKQQEVLTTRHITLLNGPRRVYYDIVLGFGKKENETKPFKCVFYDIDKVVAFAEDYSVHYGTMRFQDENIISDVSWSSIFEAKQNLVNNMVIGPATPSTTNNNSQDTNSDSNNNSKSSLLTNAFQPHKVVIPSNWTPCLLRTFEDCVLKSRIKKGGLVKTQQFKYVFMYENQADDTICLEFCTLGSHNQPIPRGYLLMKEHSIQWDS